MLDPAADCTDIAYVDEYLVAVSSAVEDTELWVATSTDNGQSFNPPITIAKTNTMFWCPKMVDNHAGEAIVLFTDGKSSGRSLSVVTFKPATNELGPIVQLAPPDDAFECANLASSSAGKAIVTLSRRVWKEWENVFFTSDDAGHTFGAPSVINVISTDDGCPEVGYAPSGTAHLAWVQNEMELMWGRSRPKRPCE